MLRTLARLTVWAFLIASAVIAAVLWRQYTSTTEWDEQPPLPLKVAVIDYTVPFDNYREHVGVMWILNHAKVPAPQDDPEWLPALHYVGYDPRDRNNPQRLAHAVTGSLNLVYIADTYGVYRDDLRDVANRKSHQDYSPVMFGGVSAKDARALEVFATGGGVLMAEFNTLADPTTPEVRAMLEVTLGIEWSGWVGRIFEDPHDTTNVPDWLGREFRKQFAKELPHKPLLVFVDRHGTLKTFEGTSAHDLAPRIHMTPKGTARFPEAVADCPYFSWFGLMQAKPGTTVLARFTAPARKDIQAALKEIGVGASPAAMTEHRKGGRRVYFAGDFADIDFDPGPYDRPDAIRRQAVRASELTAVTAAPSFWRFYAPVVKQLLIELSP